MDVEELGTVNTGTSDLIVAVMKKQKYCLTYEYRKYVESMLRVKPL